MEFKLSVLNSQGVLLSELKIYSDNSLLKSLLRNKVKINHVCEGNASCGTCLIKLIDGSLTNRSDLELEMATDRSFNTNERLSCQCKPSSNLTIQIP